MRRLGPLILSAVVLVFLVAGPAAADPITLSFVPASQTVAPGGAISVALRITGLGAFSAPSLGTYDVDVLYDPTILAFTGVSFGDPNLGNQLDLFGLGNIAVASPFTGGVNLFELSFDLPSDLDTLQPGSFTLAVLNFNALQSGTSPLSLNLNALGDSYGNSLSATTQTGSVTVVPEPGTVVLLGSGIALLILRKRNVRCG